MSETAKLPTVALVNWQMLDKATHCDFLLICVVNTFLPKTVGEENLAGFFAIHVRKHWQS